MPDKLSDPNVAAAMLKAGKLVAFPTETVYGLGADATSSAACRRIFQAKGRPPTNPLIVHVADIATARTFTAGWTTSAQRLAEEFWPGPLTLVLPRHPSICREVSAGRETVAIRVPDHPLALAMLRAFGGAVAAPSANRSNRVSPTTAIHVRHELGADVDLILDGGACPVGIESTVLDLTTFPKPTLLRPGHVSLAQIEAVVGPCAFTHRHTVTADEAAPSPGLSALHYAPQTPAYRFKREDYPKVVARLGGSGNAEDDDDTPDAACVFADRQSVLAARPTQPASHLPGAPSATPEAADLSPLAVPRHPPEPTGSATPARPNDRTPDRSADPAVKPNSAGCAVMLLSKASVPSPHDVVTMPSAPDAYARLLYATLRSLDAGGYSALYIELPPDAPEWLAVRDRLLRATRPVAWVS